MASKLLFLLLSLTVSFVFFFTYARAASCNEADRDALLQLQSTGFPIVWNSTAPPDCCTWKGVGCSPSTGRVQSLQLDLPTFPRRLSSSICRLTSLTKLRLSSATDALYTLPGTALANVPKCIGTSLLQLQFLELTNSQLVGRIPAELANLNKLEYLDLSGNNFGGGIPPQICRLTGLQYLDLSGSSSENGGHRRTRIPDCIGNSLLNLKTLSLDTLNLTGPIPASLGKLRSLEALSLTGNDFTGTIPDSLGNLSKLKVFLLDESPKLQGTIPSSFKNLVSLQRFSIQEVVNLGGPVPDFSAWSQAEFVWITSCKLTGPLPKISKPLLKLKELMLYQNQITGSIPAELPMHLPSLQSLELFSNRLSGPIPASLGSLHSLLYLRLGNNQLSGQIPGDMSDMSNLMLLDLSQNRLTGPIPQQLGRLPLDPMSLHLEWNHLTGPLPATWAEFLPSSFEHNAGLCGRPLATCK